MYIYRFLNPQYKGENKYVVLNFPIPQCLIDYMKAKGWEMEVRDQYYRGTHIGG